MALITDPDQLSATEVTISTGARTLTLNLAGNLSADGVTGQALYSYLKEEWKNDAALIPFPFPMVAITPEQFEFSEGWKPVADASRKLIRTAGWREIAVGGAVNREYMGIVTLGNIDFTDKNTGDKAYYAFATDAARTEFTYAGPVDEAVQTYGDASNGNFDNRALVFTVYIRQQGKTYDQTTSTEIGLSALTYITYRYPLSEGTDLDISAADATIDASAPYTGMTITWYTTSQSLPVGGSSYNFSVVIDGNAGTKTEIYEFVQRQLRLSTDIDSGAGTQVGFLAPALVQFVGSELQTLDFDASATEGGVYISDFAVADTNDLLFRDDSGTSRLFPFVAAGTLSFSSTLVSDGSAKYWMFFQYTKDTTPADAAFTASSGTATTITGAATLPLLTAGDYFEIANHSVSGNNGVYVATGTPTTSSLPSTKYYGTSPVNAAAESLSIRENPVNSPDALLVDDNSVVDISGTIVGATVAFDYDYDGNVQGGRAAGTDAPVLVRVIGLTTAQFAEATATLTASVANSISLVSALERNYTT